MEHGDLRRRRRQSASPYATVAIPAFTGPALLRVHLLLRVQGQQRGIQIDGAGTLWSADLSGFDFETSGRSQTRRQFLDEHGLFSLLPRTADDERAFSPVVWRTAARSGIDARTAAHGRCGKHSESDRGNHDAHGWRGASANENEGPCAGRGRGAELRRQWAAAARRSFRKYLDSARRRRRWRIAGRGVVRLVPVT